MDELLDKFIKKIEVTQLQFTRSTMSDINWKARLIGIRGARGVGTTNNTKPHGQTSEKLRSL